MPAGFAVYNDWGTVQVDENWPAMSLRLKLTVSIATRTSNFGINYYTDVRFAAAAPLVFWKSGQPVFVYFSVNNGDGTWTYRFCSDESTTITLYIFDTPEWFPQSSGLEVFNANGVKVFGDQLDPLKLVTVVPISAVPMVWNGLVPGTYAVATSDQGFMSQTYFADTEYTESLSVGARDLPQGGMCDWALSKDRFPFVINNAPQFPSQFLLVADVTNL